MSRDEFHVVENVHSDAEPGEGDAGASVTVLATGSTGLTDQMVAAYDGDAIAALHVEVDEARRGEADAEGALVVARARHTELAKSPKATPARVIAAAEAATSAERFLRVARATREAVQARLLRAEETGTDASPTGRLLRFGSVDEFVREYALPVYGHPVDGKRDNARWCDQWWLHPAALASLSALWEAFEVARLEPPPSLAAFHRDFLWPFMRELTDARGAFHACTPTSSDRRAGHTPERPWPDGPAPAGWVPTYPSESDALRRQAQEGP